MRYLLFAGLFYSFFYLWKNKPFWFAKIQQRYPENKHVAREICYSFLTILIFGAVILAVTYASKKGYTKVYHHISDYGYGYYFASILLMIFLHDTYFYWAHRIMHWKLLFKIVHKVHHLSTNPTPFAAYAFHPIEAFVEVGIIPLIAFTILYHPTTNMHHRLIKCNYGLYFNIGDRLMKTNHIKYEQHFDEVASQKKPGKERCRDFSGIKTVYPFKD
ncbi:sterol desaturase [Mucilaginibacter sp. HMF7410]|uniref:Sterol desaturase n=2 Tax=Mucilaginibacter arboris TaxID=2682090 RepID=A0A7K1STT1_9SPHI|nr:sterol desaturase [Mucilaginibacter arboris]